RIPELAFLFLELRCDRRQRPLAFGDAPIILRAEQAEIQLQRIGGLGGMAGDQQGDRRRHRAECSQGFEQVAHGESAGKSTQETVPRSPDKVKCSAATPDGQVRLVMQPILSTAFGAHYGGLRAKWSLRCEELWPRA